MSDYKKRVYPHPDQLDENNATFDKLRQAEQALVDAGIPTPHELLLKIEEASKLTKAGLPEWATNASWVEQLEASKVAIERALDALEGNGAFQAVVNLREQLRIINQILAEPVERLHNLSRASYAKKVSGVMTNTETSPIELSPELEEGLAKIQQNFDNMPELHPGIEWEEVARALRADPESLKAFIEANQDGYSVNVFGKEDGYLVFVTAQLDARKITERHRNIMFDAQVQKDYPQDKVNGNAETVATEMGMELADEKYHKQLIALYGGKMYGAFYLKTDEATRKTGNARCGVSDGVNSTGVDFHTYRHAARFSRRVKTT